MKNFRNYFSKILYSFVISQNFRVFVISVYTLILAHCAECVYYVPLCTPLTRTTLTSVFSSIWDAVDTGPTIANKTLYSYGHTLWHNINWQINYSFGTNHMTFTGILLATTMVKISTYFRRDIMNPHRQKVPFLKNWETHHINYIVEQEGTSWDMFVRSLLCAQC